MRPEQQQLIPIAYTSRTRSTEFRHRNRRIVGGVCSIDALLSDSMCSTRDVSGAKRTSERNRKGIRYMKGGLNESLPLKGPGSFLCGFTGTGTGIDMDLLKV